MISGEGKADMYTSGSMSGGYHGNRVRPYDDHAAGCCACCRGRRRDEFSTGGSRAYHTMHSSSDTYPHGAIFLVPGRPEQGGGWRVLEASLVHSYPPNGKTTSPPAPQHTRAVGTQTTGDVLASPAVVKTPRSRKSISDITVTPSTYVILHDNDDSVWKGNHRSHQTQTEEDDLLLTSPPNGRPWEKRAKEVRTWMPHRHPVRSINTSTK
ncbi:hypothetical protein C0Q70_14634 [Pomacea canaliculata]|uniref:Uncharacterized protein n=1 Tax=Pomacea canaliculata TaxID=400727 RepID=A0A2T7NSL4_POMCA|nr:hypothetical protein C0Q70_14634 [Pomacea canaliculata]